VRVRFGLFPASSNRFIASLVTLVLAGVSLLTLSGAASAQRYVSFDGPGAIYYTFPTSINQSGQIVGYYSDSTAHSFLRNSDGTIISFDPPNSTGSVASSINNAGEITGYWFDSAGDHGYCRSAAGDFTTFDVPTTAQEVRTIPYWINAGGSIVGYYSDGVTFHGFVYDSSGNITTFDPPGSTLTVPESINQSGFISGGYYDSASLLHGSYSLRREVTQS